ncbi:hypothetical protein QA612_09945 [Evansella sp. AB-P1]|uniref:hypothetical protein n=1 Tax=Evansella sp. AB-P1 TaxID=3037653 RepID=UPI00242019F4|nr:hypothetical protein [Evansella sp. AB-P1]MDG5787820.1 hypothetical protein [Evansella sp. AB-P1]
MVRSIYFYLVMLITLVMMIGGAVSSFIFLSDIVFPTPYYESFDEYSLNRAYFNDKSTSNEDLSHEELYERYEQLKSDSIDREKAYAKNGFFKSLAWILIPLPVFFIARKQLKNRE